MLIAPAQTARRSEEHTSELQSLRQLVCRLLLEKKDGFIHLAGVGEHGAFVEINGASICRIILHGSSPLRRGFVGLARFGPSVGKCFFLKDAGASEVYSLFLKLNLPC